jgi:hypothetical protein
MAAIEKGPKTDEPVWLEPVSTQETTNITHYTFMKEDEKYPYVDVKTKPLPRNKEQLTAHGPVSLVHDGQRIPYRRVPSRVSSLELKKGSMSESQRIEVAQGLARLLFELQHTEEKE